MFQRASILGKVSQEPSLKVTPQGKEVLEIHVKISIAMEKDKDGSVLKWGGDFWKLTFWEGHALSTQKRAFQKGDTVLATGRFRVHQYESKGEKRVSLEMYQVESMDRVKSVTPGAYKSALREDDDEKVDEPKKIEQPRKKDAEAPF